MMKVLFLSCCFFITSDASAANTQILETLKAQDFKIRSQEHPERLRILENIRISGSAQFSSQSLNKIVEEIREKAKHPIVILDVRQEMHLLGESSLADQIAEKDWSEINHKLEFIIKDEEALAKQTSFAREETIAQSCGLQYVRIPVTDDSVPTQAEVDTFLTMYREKIQQDPNTWFHVHCEHGHGRTTSFMAMLHILNTQGTVRLSDILHEQLEKGGADLAFPPPQNIKIKDAELQRSRYAFLEEFHQYVSDKEKGFLSGKTWSEWKQIVEESN